MCIFQWYSLVVKPSLSSTISCNNLWNLNVFFKNQSWIYNNVGIFIMLSIYLKHFLWKLSIEMSVVLVIRRGIYSIVFHGIVITNWSVCVWLLTNRSVATSSFVIPCHHSMSDVSELYIASI